MLNFRPGRLFLFISLTAILLARVTGPSALQRFDQPKTVSYTADIVANGNWLLPRDILGRPATKPPLVNWLAAPVVAMGFWTEWAVKWPMLAGSLASTDGKNGRDQS
jgi:4-amino-4-deoxy-L-arabinose transferase-like glycosyltransferase